ncbi:MAG: class I tRNA ligase family protein [Actinomycetota bacterium]
MAKAAGDAVRSGQVIIEPESLAPRYFEWVDNMHDWCISRQLWWGTSHSSLVWPKWRSRSDGSGRKRT